MLAGIPIGVAYAQEPPITQAIKTALGSAPMPCAMDMQIGAISAVVAVFDIKFVSTQQSTNTTNVNINGDGFSPSIAITFSAIRSPAPVSPSAAAKESVPPNRKIVFKSIDFKASFSEITPVKINTKAPIQPVTQSFIPIYSSKIIPTRVRIKTTNDTICFHFGTSSKLLVVSNAPSSVGSLSGRSLCPIVA